MICEVSGQLDKLGKDENTIYTTNNQTFRAGKSHPGQIDQYAIASPTYAAAAQTYAAAAQTYAAAEPIYAAAAHRNATVSCAEPNMLM